MLLVRNSIISHNGTGAAGGGVLVNSTAGSAKGAIINTAVHNNFVGLSVQNQSNIQVNESTISENVGTGIAQSGAATVRVGRSLIVNNLGSATTGTVLSYLDNQINNNNPDTTPGTAGGYK